MNVCEYVGALLFLLSDGGVATPAPGRAAKVTPHFGASYLKSVVENE